MRDRKRKMERQSSRGNRDKETEKKRREAYKAGAKKSLPGRGRKGKEETKERTNRERIREGDGTFSPGSPNPSSTSPQAQLRNGRR